MSRSKNPPQLSSKSAWTRGPPQNSATTTPSSSQSPTSPTPISGTNPAHFHATHSRRSSALGQKVSIKDGVNIPRSAVKQGSPVIFGSIDAIPAPISSSPASAPAVKPADGVKSFGSVAVQNGVSDAAKSAVINRPPPISSASSTSSSHPAPPPAPTPSAPKFDKKSIAKLFQGPSIQSTPNPPHEVASPASRSASLPSQHSQGQPYPPNSPPGALRQGQNGNSSARTASSSHMFSMLQSSDVIVDPPPSKRSRPPSRKPRVDLGLGVDGPPEPAPQRRNLQLLPRTRPVGEESKASTPAVSESGSDDEAVKEGGTPGPAAISEGQAKWKINDDVKEFFSIRKLDEAELYFSGLPTEHRHRLVDALVTKSVEMKAADMKLVSDLFVRVREKGLCSPAVFEEGFNWLAELLDYLPVFIPKAWLYFAILLKGSGLDQDEERYARIAEKTMDPDRLNHLF